MISLFFINPVFADKKTLYYANKCFEASKNSLKYLGAKQVKFSSRYKYGQIYKGTIPEAREDRVLCEAYGGMGCNDSMEITISVILPWGEKQQNDHVCFFNEYGDVGYVHP